MQQTYPLITNALERLFPHAGAKRFRAEYWPHRCLVEHGALERFGRLGDEPIFDHPIELIERAAPQRMVAYVRQQGGCIRQVRGSADEAKRAYADGMTVSIEGIDGVVPAVRAWARALRRETGYGPRTRDVALLLSPPGEAVPKHFDGTEVLVVHLRGRKRWTLAENRGVRFPGFSHFVGEERGLGARDAAQMASDPMRSLVERERLMPADAEVHELLPGSVAFVPRGFWHETHAHTRTVSLTFKLLAASAAGLVMPELESRLRRLEAWRKPLALWGNNATAEVSRRHVRELLRELPILLDELLATETWRAAPNLFRVAPEKRVAFSAEQAEQGHWELTIVVENRRDVLELDVDPAPLCELVRTAQGFLNEEDVSSALPELAPAGIRALCEELVAIGALERSDVSRCESTNDCKAHS